MKRVNLVSTALVADWTKKGSLVCTPLTSKEFSELVKNAGEVVNYCGHPTTTSLLKSAGLNIPDQLVQVNQDGKPKIHPKFGTPMGAFWDGQGVAVAARPRGGVRSAQANGDTQVSSLDELEFLKFEFISE